MAETPKFAFSEEARSASLAARRAVKSPHELLAAASLNRTRPEIAKIAKRLEDTPETMRKTYLRAVSGRSKLAAIRAFCAECCGWQREEVRLCTAPACPLYPYRPFRGMVTRSETGEAGGDS